MIRRNLVFSSDILGHSFAVLAASFLDEVLVSVNNHGSLYKNTETRDLETTNHITSAMY